MLGYPQFGLLGGASHLVNGSKKQLYIYLISHLIVWNEIWARFMDSTRFPRISTDAHPTMNKKLQCPSTNSNWLVVWTPLKNISSSVGMMTFPTEWTNNQNVPNHQPAKHCNTLGYPQWLDHDMTWYDSKKRHMKHHPSTEPEPRISSRSLAPGAPPDDFCGILQRSFGTRRRKMLKTSIWNNQITWKPWEIVNVAYHFRNSLKCIYI